MADDKIKGGNLTG